MSTVIICVGIPASGKSTWARTKAIMTGAYVTERDALRAEIHCEDGNLNNYKYTKHKEQFVTSVQRQRISTALQSGVDVIISDTNLNSHTRDELHTWAESHGAEVVYKVFDTSLKDCIKRNLKRTHTVPESVMVRMEKRMREYLDKPMYNFDMHLPNCMIVDIDGTVADMTGVRGPFEWNKVYLDNPICPVIDLINGYREVQGANLVFFSGRDGSCERDTRNWLDQYFSHYELYMRPAGNSQSDDIIKEQLFKDHVQGRYNVDFVMDDRKQVVQLWESMNLKVINVGGTLSDF